MFNNLGGTNLTWLLVLLLLLGDNENGFSCDTLIWLLLLSRSCGCDGNGIFGGCGCSQNNTRPCGCSSM